MAQDKQSKVCLDVAVDHRIRRLFKPVCNGLTERSNHVFRIKVRGRSLKRPRSEIQVTAQLARPAVKGGIAVTLQQPRHNHPFEDGLDAVIEDCETLHALDDVFSAVSCGSLNIRTDVTVVDLLPYVFEDIATIDDATLKESFRASKHIMLDKEPSVLLCAGRIRLPNAGEHYKLKGDARKLESIGVGLKFGNTPQTPVLTKISHEGERRFVTIRRVNGFHPSHAMNHNPHVSCLRQLQILIGTETCGVLRGDWEEKEWMGELRYRCQDITRALSESPTRSPRRQSPSQNSTRRNNVKYLPDYQKLYSEKLSSIHERVESLISKPISAIQSPTALYKHLLSSGLSEICNDASLILREMFRLKLKAWPDFAVSKNERALKKAASDTVRVAKDLLKAAEPGKDTQFGRIIQEGARFLLKSVTIGCGRRLEYELDFDKAWDAFLKIATDIETLLMDLLLEEEKALYEILPSEMGMLTLASADNSAASPLSRVSHA